MDVSPELLRGYASQPVEEARRLRAVWSAAARAVTSRGYPFPLRSWPPDAAIDIQALAEAINTDTVALAAGAARAATTQTRTGEASAGAGVNVPVTAALTLPAAPPGAYLATCTARAKSLNGTDIYGGLVLSATATGLSREWLMEVADRYWKVMDASTVHIHAGGDLTVAWNAKFTTGAGVLLGAASHSTLTRISI